MLYGYLTTREEFLFPDRPVGPLPSSTRVCCAANGTFCLQILLAAQEKVNVRAEGPFRMECCEMRPMPVHYNTGNGIDQGGAMVLQPAEKPAYAVRRAPFEVYDCLVPAPQGEIAPRAGRAAMYLVFHMTQGTKTGELTETVTLETRDGSHVCRVTAQVYDVQIPADTFPITNWFSLAAIARCHGLAEGTPEYLEMVRRYALAMRRAHQTVFFMNLEDDRCVVSKKPWTFDFEYLTPVIETFFRAGMKTMELGTLLGRGKLPNGLPDMMTGRFTCGMAEEVLFESAEGYALITAYLQALAAYLKKHGFHDRVLFHIHDEPDVHYRDEGTLADRRRQYYLAAGMVRRYLPGARIIEAVKSTAFYGGVDIFVPIIDGYEANRTEFDRYAAMGDEVWTYVCCGPQGNYLNRFMDFALLKGRLLFWGCARYRLGGYLHWGFNQFPAGMDPFAETSCPNPTGLGTSFPAGDSFLVLPGDKGPWLTMRFEAARRGAEDVMLLNLLREKDPAAHARIVAKVFRGFSDYNDDPAFFDAVFEELLAALSQRR